MQKQYAIFGGSFNPIHQGHVSVVKQLLFQNLDNILIIPTGCSPFKQKQTLLPAHLRWEMVRCVFQNWERVVVSDIEIQSERVHYTYDTLKSLDKQYIASKWHLVLGWDAYQDFRYWKNAQEILNMASLWIVARVGYSPQGNSLEQAIKAPITSLIAPLKWVTKTNTLVSTRGEVARYFTFDIPDVSSTDIREGRKSLDWIPQKARSLFQQHQAS